MNRLTRWDPFSEMLSMRNAMDRLFDSTFGDLPEGWQTGNLAVALDVSENENEYVVKASLPGIKPEDLDVTFTNGTLTIRGEIKSDEDVEQKNYHMRERRFGRFARSVSLPSHVKADDIQAEYEAGILTLHIPKAEELKPKRIQIKSGEQQQMLEGKLGDVKKS